MLEEIISSIYGCPRKSSTKSKISNRVNSHRIEDAAEDLHIVEMEEVGVTEVGEATVEVGAVEEDEAAHEAVEVLSSLRACLTISMTTVYTTREIGNASRHDTTEIGNGLNGSSLTLERLSVTKDVHPGKARH